jgi:hypothetical protein
MTKKQTKTQRPSELLQRVTLKKVKISNTSSSDQFYLDISSEHNTQLSSERNLYIRMTYEQLATLRDEVNKAIDYEIQRSMDKKN